MRHLWLRLFSLLFSLGLIAAVAAAPAHADPAEIRPGIPASVPLKDGSVLPLSPAASNADLVAQLQGVREQLTEQGMALLGQLMAHIPGGNGPSAGSPTMTVTPTTGIAPDSTVAITGAGYRAGENIYVTQTIAKPSSGYPSTYADAQKVTADGTGAFTTTLKIVKSFSDVDCARTECFVASFTAFPKLTDRSQDVWVPISLSGGPAAPGQTPQNNGVTNGGAPNNNGTTNNGTTNSGTGPSVSLDRASGLNPAGDTVSVRGTGFSTSGPGVYVGIAQTDKFSTTDQATFGADTVWVSSSKGNLNQDGSFNVQLPVKAKFGSSDCTAHTCAVYTFAAHGSSDRSQDTATPVAFVGGPAANGPVTIPGDGGASRKSDEPANDGPKTAAVSLSTTEIAASGTTVITVNGTGFSNEGPGVYVGLTETGKFSTTDANAFGAVAWVMPKEISADGSFSKSIEASPVWASGNCIKNPCAVYTFAAHGSSDRSQDTMTTVTVSGTDAEKKEAEKDAAKKAADEKKAAAAKAGNKTNDDVADTSENRAAAVDSGDPTTWWPWAVGGAALVIAAGVGGYLAGQRKRS